MMHFNFQNIYILNLNFVIFILSSVIFCSQGRSNGYISMGLSKDNTMGDDLTTNCVINTSGQVDINTGETNVSREELIDHFVHLLRSEPRTFWQQTCQERKR